MRMEEVVSGMILMGLKWQVLSCTCIRLLMSSEGLDGVRHVCSEGAYAYAMQPQVSAAKDCINVGEIALPGLHK